MKYRNILRNRNIYIFFTSQTTIESLKSLLKSVITFIIYLIYNSINNIDKARFITDETHFILYKKKNKNLTLSFYITSQVSKD